MEEKKDTDKKFIINEYKKLIILIVLSIIVCIMIFGFYLKDSRTIVFFGLGVGLALGVDFLYSLIYSLKSENKWCIIVSFNDDHEGIFEIILSIMVIIVGIIAIIECFVNIF